MLLELIPIMSVIIGMAEKTLAEASLDTVRKNEEALRRYPPNNDPTSGIWSAAPSAEPYPVAK